MPGVEIRIFIQIGTEWMQVHQQQGHIICLTVKITSMTDRHQTMASSLKCMNFNHPLQRKSQSTKKFFIPKRPGALKTNPNAINSHQRELNLLKRSLQPFTVEITINKIEFLCMAPLQKVEKIIGGKEPFMVLNAPP